MKKGMLPKKLLYLEEKMKMNKIYLTCDRSVSKDVELSVKDAIKAVILKILDFEKLDFPASVNVVISNNRKIKKLNKDFRGIDKETDVLSFPLLIFDEHLKCEEEDFHFYLRI